MLIGLEAIGAALQGQAEAAAIASIELQQVWVISWGWLDGSAFELIAAYSSKETATAAFRLLTELGDSGETYRLTPLTLHA